jgi:aminomethyltransferase
VKTVFNRSSSFGAARPANQDKQPMTEPLKSIPLEALHRELGARFSPFAGYQMPVQYGLGLKGEHLHTRSAAGLFDVSHMGQLLVTGPNPEEALERALPVDFAGWQPGEQRYTVLLNNAGGIIDDLMVARTVQGELRLVVNAGNRDADLARLMELCPTLSFKWIPAALIALQGPLAEALLSQLDPRAAHLRFMHGEKLSLDGATCWTTRSGYTGEDGYEISIPIDVAERMTRLLLQAGDVVPVGLGARDTLRLEAGLPLHGNDIGPDVTPVEAGLVFAIAKNRRPSGAKAGGFPGAAVILDQLVAGPAKRLVGFTSDSAVPIRHGASIVTTDDHPAGVVTSGTFSPSLGYPVLMAMIDSSLIGQPLIAQVRQHRLPINQVPLPFVPKRFKR